jgi:hypothetical protein
MELKTWKELLKRAEALRRPWENIFEEAFDYALPNRARFRQATQPGASVKGDRHTDNIFDQTAVVGVQEFASRLQYNMLPPFARWARLVPGKSVPETDREELQAELDVITEKVFAALGQSSFDQEVTESFFDLAASQGQLLMERGRSGEAIECRAVSLSQVFVINAADGKPSALFYVEVLSAEQIMNRYADDMPADKLDELRRGEKDKQIRMVDAFRRVEGSYRNPKWERDRFCLDPDFKIGETKKYQGEGSSPWVLFRWNVAAGEEYGRGPLLSVLPTVRVVNLLMEFILDNAEWSVAGAYQADDDGVINPDTVVLEPRVIIPRSPGSKIERIDAAGDIGVGLELVSHLQDAIKKGLYNERLGKREGTPPSATEVQERMLELARDIGSAFGRLQAELARPVIMRALYLLDDAGEIRMPKVDGQVIDIEIQSPLSQAQRMEDVQNFMRFGEMVTAIYGPQASLVVLDQTEGPAYLAERLMVPMKLVRSKEEAAELLNKMMEAAQAQAQGPAVGPAQAAPAPSLNQM